MENHNRRINVLHLIDTLDAGGAERVVVNLVNELPRKNFNPYLCTTRRNGQLLSFVKSDVNTYSLNRSKMIDLKVIRKLINFIKSNQIDIIHAHSTSLFIAKLVRLFVPSIKIIWHVHYGNLVREKRSKLVYRLGISGINGIFAVNQQLASWSVNKLNFDSDRVWYIPNFAQLSIENNLTDTFPGTQSKRIVCLANLRPQKDHLTLIRAMEKVKATHRTAHLLLVGDTQNKAVLDSVKSEIAKLDLTENISILGQQSDVPAIISACNIGVLSSISEGLPLSLLEYGLAKLPVVVTDVGQCRDVLKNGSLGLIVPIASPEKLAEAISFLLENPKAAEDYGDSFHAHVKDNYSSEKIVQKICDIYETVLTEKSRS